MNLQEDGQETQLFFCVINDELAQDRGKNDTRNTKEN